MTTATETRNWWTWTPLGEADEGRIIGRLRWWLRQYPTLRDGATAKATAATDAGERFQHWPPGAWCDLAAVRGDLERALAALTDRQREAVVRCCIGGQSARQAAAAMTTSRGQVRALIASGLRDAARILT